MSTADIIAMISLLLGVGAMVGGAAFTVARYLQGSFARVHERMDESDQRTIDRIDEGDRRMMARMDDGDRRMLDRMDNIQAQIHDHEARIAVVESRQATERAG